MANYVWGGNSGDWQNGADWAGGAPPGSGDTAIISSSANLNISVNESVAVGGIVLDDANAAIWDADNISLTQTLLLQAGTLGLCSGTVTGGTLDLAGGVLVSEGGGLVNTTVEGVLEIAETFEVLNLYGQNSFRGAGGTGSASVSLTAVGATLNLVGSQSISNVDVFIGSQAPVGFGGPAVLQNSGVSGSQAASTLTIAGGADITLVNNQAEIATGQVSGDAVVNDGLIQAGSRGGILEIGGAGTFINNGTIDVSNGATLDVSGCTFINQGALSINGGTIEFSGAIQGTALASLRSATLTQATVLISGDSANTGYTMDVGGTGPLAQVSLAGTITGGTIADTGPGLTFVGAGATLNSVSYQGTLQVSSGQTLTIANSLGLSTNGGNGIVNVEGAGAALELEGNIALGAMTVNLGAANGTAEIGTADTWTQSSVTTATLGAGLTVEQMASSATINIGYYNMGQYLIGDTIINDGTILNTTSGDTLTVSGIGVFENAGSISIGAGAAMVEEGGSFENSGTLSLASNAVVTVVGTNALTGLPDYWSNSGIVDLNGGTLALVGNCTDVSLGSFSGSGTVDVEGTLTNSYNTMSIGGNGGVPVLELDGTISGGNISCPSGNLVASSDGSAALSGVSLVGLLSLNSVGQSLSIEAGTSLQGTVEVEGAAAALIFVGSETLNHAVVDLGSSSAVGASLDVYQAGSATPTLTLGPQLTVSVVNSEGSIGGAADEPGSMIVNLGTISDGSAQSTLSLLGSDFVNHGIVSVSGGATLLIDDSGLSNAGTIEVASAKLLVESSLALATLQSMRISNSRVSISGELNESGGTLTVGTGSQLGTVFLSGEIEGGTIRDGGAGLQAADGAILDDVTYCGTLALTSFDSCLTIEGGCSFTGYSGTGAGSINLTGEGAKLIESGDGTISNATVYLGSSTIDNGQAVPAAELDSAAGGTLTIASNSVVRSAGPTGVIGDATLDGWSDTIVNDGMIVSAQTGGTVRLASTYFQNVGGLIIGGTSNLLIDDASFENLGGMSIASGGSVDVSLSEHEGMPDAPSVPFVNSGTIRSYGGNITEIAAGGLLTAVPLVNSSTGTIVGFGNINAPISNSGTILSSYASTLDIAGPVTGTGTLEVNSGCVLELGASVDASQTIVFEGPLATVRLNSPLGFTGSVEGFQSGDAFDITGPSVDNVSIVNGRLLIGTSNGSLAISSKSALAGELSVGKDVHGGHVVAYTAQSPGSGVGGESQVTISVSQPQMLFWASPVGDTFAGTSSNLNGATIANWTTADTLDLTDFLPSAVSLAYTQSTTSGTLVITEGAHSADITFTGIYHSSWFGVAPDQHGGTLITYSH